MRTNQAHDYAEDDRAQRWGTRSITDKLKILEQHFPSVSRFEMRMPGISQTLAASTWSNLPPIVQAALRRNFYTKGGQ